MTTLRHYDALVIGAGQSGTPLALALAKAGRKTALIEREHVGGSCVNVGCSPTKTMVASARVAYLARRAGDYGVRTGPVSLDLKRVQARKNGIISRFRTSDEDLVGATKGLDLIYGEARFRDTHSVQVHLTTGGTRHLSAETIFLNTGDRPSIPSIPGLDSVEYLDSTTIMELRAVPEHLMILGGGYVALEFAQMFRRFGSQVTILQRSGQLLSREDSDVAEAVAQILREDDIDIRLQAETVHIAPESERSITLTIRGADGERTLSGSHLLVATGRTPNTERLGLSAAGIPTDEHGYITSDERLRTPVAGIYAIGDVKGGPAFTATSFDDFRIVKTNLLEGGDA
ncbi:MAG TPA: FAD-dependent oxidoreductase, partial [Ktedonobacterales bacterium]|nr:FAD-dependent oxidoreductase [Ktedonobacterales bacterium]